MVCDVCSVTWTVTWLYAVRRGLAGRQCRWNVEVQPVSVRTSMTRRRAADTAPCPTCAGRSCSVWACRPRPTATSTVSSNDCCSLNPAAVVISLFTLTSYAHTHTIMLTCFSILFTTDRLLTVYRLFLSALLTSDCRGILPIVSPVWLHWLDRSITSLTVGRWIEEAS